MNSINKNAIGWIGAFCILLAYFFLSFNYLKQTDISYNVLNFYGGMCLAFRVYLDKNWSNFWLEVIFCLIALKSIIC